ncbi:MAG: hypothetical protein H6745_12355 [Deltaproteobacteria bacterium]|nr:hypothetical protein [Deltaproteobacteria bacterium]
MRRALRLRPAIVAGALALVAVALPTGAWLVAELRSFEHERAALLAAPAAEAEAAAGRIAARVDGRVTALLAREGERPIFHYQNLFVDARAASEGLAVTPSPLAAGPPDPLMADPFEVDAAGEVGLPTLNPDYAALSNDQRAQEAVRARLAATVGPYVAALRDREALAPEPRAAVAIAAAEHPTAPPPEEVQVAVNAPPQAPTQAPARAARRPVQAPMNAAKATPPVEAEQVQEAVQEQAPVQLAALGNGGQLVEQRIGGDNYLSNVNANEVYYQIQLNKGEDIAPPQKRGVVPQVKGSAAAAPARAPAKVAAPRKRPPAPATAPAPTEPAPPPPVEPPPDPPPAPPEVTVRVGAFALHTVPRDDDGPAELFALRRVATPDGERTQGFRLAQDELAPLLAEGDLTGRLVPGPATDTTPGAALLQLPGDAWHVEVPFAAAAASARAEVDDRAAAIRLRVALGGLLALLAAAAVVAMVVHSERLARRRAEFAAAAAHELRTPLAGVRMYGEMLAEGLGNPERHKTYAKRVAAEAERLGRVVANVLEFTRLERGSLAVRPTPGDLAQAVTEIVTRVEAAALAAGAEVVLTVPDAPIPEVTFDRDAVAQILANLVDNAEKYGRGAADRRVEVEVAATPIGAEIAVRDRGPGVPRRLERRLFRAFERGGDADQPAGLGLGLSLAQVLATGQGGALRYAPRPGGGSAFTLTLPWAAPKGSPARPGAARADATPD